MMIPPWRNSNTDPRVFFTYEQALGARPQSSHHLVRRPLLGITHLTVRDELKTLWRPAPSGWAEMLKSATLGRGTAHSRRRLTLRKGSGLRAPETAARGR